MDEAEAGPIPLVRCLELSKAIKESIYTLLDTYKGGDSARCDAVMNGLVDLCRQLVELGAEHDPDAVRPPFPFSLTLNR